MRCPKCRSEENVKSGHHLGRQRYRCKECGCQFTREQPRGESVEKKCLAIILYANGLSFRAIAKIIKVSPKAVFDWVKAFGLETNEKPKPQSDVLGGLDEMWRLIDAKKTSPRLEKHIVALQLNSSTGNVEAVAVKP